MQSEQKKKGRKSGRVFRSVCFGCQSKKEEEKKGTAIGQKKRKHYFLYLKLKL